jgi:2-polyprenyl-3-methyl-5-hydroxy-6-metoxy-1,4-benzoquinol methylase
MSKILGSTVIDGIECFSADVAKAYDDYPHGGFETTDENAGKSFWVASRNRLFHWLVQQHLSVSGRTRLLEIGCGTGDFVRRLVDDKRLEVTGSEIYLGGLAFAKRNMPEVRFIQFDVTQGIIGETFELITAFDVLEHVENDQAAICNIHDMLANDGVAIISVPQHQFMWSRLDEIVRHKRRYSRSEMVGQLVGNGFEVLRATSFVFSLFPLMFLSRLLDRNRRVDGEADDANLESRVSFPPFINSVFDLIMRLDEALIRRGVSLPIGGTLVVVARKR